MDQKNVIIGLCGSIGVGKDTAAGILGYKKMSFAGRLKDVTAAAFAWPRDLMEGDTDESRKWRDIPDEYWSGVFKTPWTPRIALQKIGTELFRNNLNQNIWVECLKQELVTIQENIVITDARFPNEIDMLTSLGAKIYWVRNVDPVWQDEYMMAKDSSVLLHEWKRKYPDVHSTEYSWMGCDFTDIIWNKGTIDDLTLEIDKKIKMNYNNT